MLELDKILSTLLEREKVLPLFLSTYFTSMLWFGFVASALAIRALSKISRPLSIAFQVIAAHEAPARATAGFLCAALAIVYFVTYVVSIVIG